MAHKESRNHFLLLTYPAQGHVNPALELAKRLLRTGAQVTFITTVYGQHRMVKNPDSYPDALAFAPFSDGYDDGLDEASDDVIIHYMNGLSRRGSEAISRLVQRFANEGRPVTCIIYSLLVHWAAETAHKLQIPSAFFWNQAAAVFDIYYYYYRGQKDLFLKHTNDPSTPIKLPNLPPLKAPDLPSFFLPSNPYGWGIRLFGEQFETISQEPKSFSVLINTFDGLEEEAMKSVDKFNMIGIGPLITSAFLDAKSPSDNSTPHSEDYIEWLHSQEQSSVVYVSFGSMAVLSNKQMEELARGLVDSGRPFLWVIRSGDHGTKQKAHDKNEDDKYREILREEHKGIVVPWCSQVAVLNHGSVGCFVTHCGWNSTLETIAMGVPVVAFPQWTDQGTNAKFMEDVWKIGVRVRPDEEDKIVKSEEVIRCLEQVMGGERCEEFRNNARKWKDAAREAGKEGGSSDSNLRAFVLEMART